MFGGHIKVVGIGSVELPTKISPTMTGPNVHGILRLRNVLHIPDIFCNIIGHCGLDNYEVTTRYSSGASGYITSNCDGRPIAYFKPKNGKVIFWEVRLSGPPVGPKVGPSPFDPNSGYSIQALWPDSERHKFAASQEAFAALHASRQSQSTLAGPLTPAEKAWLKANWGNEFKFLRAHGLKIHDDDDREYGRRILRATMSDGDEDMT